MTPFPTHSYMAMESAIVVSASAAAAYLDAFVVSIVAPVAIVASFARFANVAMALAFCACWAAFACMALSCQIISASAAARSRYVSLLAFRYI